MPSFLTTLTSVLVLELAARSVMPSDGAWEQQVRSDDPAICFALRPNSAAVYRLPGFFSSWVVATNALGLQGPLPSPAANPARLRVAVLGSGAISGSGTGFQGALPARLAAALERSGLAVDVVNVGVMGYKSEQQVRFFAKIAKQLQANVVIWAAVEGDVDPPECGLAAAPPWLRRVPALVQLAYWWHDDRNRWQGGTNYRRSTGLQADRRAVAQLAAMAKRLDFQVYVVVVSTDPTVHNQRLASWEAQQWQVLDLQSFYAGDRRPPRFASLLGNLSAQGNDDIARHLVVELAKRGAWPMPVADARKVP